MFGTQRKLPIKRSLQYSVSDSTEFTPNHSFNKNTGGKFWHIENDFQEPPLTTL